jgi:hypothetical protein
MAWGEIHPGQNDYGTFLLLMIVSLLLPLALALLLVLIVGAQRCCVVVSTWVLPPLSSLSSLLRPPSSLSSLLPRPSFLLPYPSSSFSSSSSVTSLHKRIHSQDG